MSCCSEHIGRRQREAGQVGVRVPESRRALRCLMSAGGAR